MIKLEVFNFTIRDKINVNRSYGVRVEHDADKNGKKRVCLSCVMIKLEIFIL